MSSEFKEQIHDPVDGPSASAPLSNAAADPILSVENLCVSYGHISAVKNVSFNLQQGEVLTLVGANGAGKSTTLRALSGMLPYTGKISLHNRSLKGLSPNAIVAKGMSHVPEGRRIFGNLTVHENLQLGAWLRRNRKELREDYERLLALFPRLAERIGQIAGTLSGGEQQMLALARALMSRASILLLDEPSMGLAPKLVHEVFRIIQEINKQGVTILLVEQNAHQALQIAHRACLLETGKIILSGSSRDLLKSPIVREAYLGG